MVTVGQQAPDFTLSDENGKPVKLNSFKGKKLVVFFYDSDSAPATPDEHKRIKNVYKKYKLTDVDVPLYWSRSSSQPQGDEHAVRAPIPFDSPTKTTRFARFTACHQLLVGHVEDTVW